MRRSAVAALACLIVLPLPASAQEIERRAFVLVVTSASMPELLEVQELRSLAARGGIALMNGRSGAESEMRDLQGDQGGRRFLIANGQHVDDLAGVLGEFRLIERGPTLLMVLATSSAP